MDTKTFPSPKRIRTRSMDQEEVYNSDEDLNSDAGVDYTSSSSSSIEDPDDTDGSELGSSSSMDHSGNVNDPGFIVAKDGTKWVEDFSDAVPRSMETCLIDQITSLTELSQKAQSITGTILLCLLIF